MLHEWGAHYRSIATKSAGAATTPNISVKTTLIPNILIKTTLVGASLLANLSFAAN
jgi:hypothetical protein